MNDSRFDLQGKTALITGSAGLLGIQHAAALLETRADVVLTDIDTKKLTDTESHLKKLFPHANIKSYYMDVTNIDSINFVYNSFLDSKKYVQILINNAAIDPKVKVKKALEEISRLETLSLEQWNLEISVGLTGAFLCSQVFGAAMAKAKGGVILNIASDLSIISPDQRLYRKPDLSEDSQPVKPVTYSVIKSGLVGLTRYLATYWAADSVRCNALSPGGVYDGQHDDFVKKLVDKIPLGRMASQEEYRGAVQFLCSDASSYMNGQNVVIDGGRSVW